MPRKSNKEAVLAVCVQETVEDGSEMKLGDEFSSEDIFFLHQAFLADTLVNILGMDSFDVHLFYGDSPGTKKAVKTILKYLKDRLKGKKASAIDSRLQVTELKPERWGVKMDRVFKQCFADGYKHVLFIGSRTPTLGEKHIKVAYKMLKQSDAVFGPTVQGRYYLLGMSGKYHVDLSKFDWKAPNIYSEVTECFNEKGLSWAELEMWYAVEHPEDLEFLVRDINQYRLEGDEESARETEMVLRRVMERQT
jgi:glycosyltransferase A (GT-A) superfamily protein (DUF2064 family)